MTGDNSRRGFTLIELLVVIAIIGILASIVLASLNTARLKGRDARRLADLKEIQTALDLYYSNHNAYPVQTTQAAAATALASVVTDGDMSVIPDDPLGGTTHYVYISPIGGAEYCLGSTLEGTAPPGASSSCTNGLTLTGIQYAVNP